MEVGRSVVGVDGLRSSPTARRGERPRGSAGVWRGATAHGRPDADADLPHLERSPPNEVGLGVTILPRRSRHSSHITSVAPRALGESCPSRGTSGRLAVPRPGLPQRGSEWAPSGRPAAVDQNPGYHPLDDVWISTAGWTQRRRLSGLVKTSHMGHLVRGRAMIPTLGEGPFTGASSILRRPVPFRSGAASIRGRGAIRGRSSQAGPDRWPSRHENPAAWSRTQDESGHLPRRVGSGRAISVDPQPDRPPMLYLPLVLALVGGLPEPWFADPILPPDVARDEVRRWVDARLVPTPPARDAR